MAGALGSFQKLGKMITRIALYLLGAVATLAVMAVIVLYFQGKRRPSTEGQYVALGSSYAAGLGLGPREAGSPFVCMRSTNGYPHLLARLTGLKLVDVSCSGSTTAHILNGGPAFLRPQLDAVGPNAKLVTITSGGNDVSYVGDLTFSAGAAGAIGKLMWKGAKPLEQRDFAAVTANFVQIIKDIKSRAPAAQVVLVSYPEILPPKGSCEALNIDARMADLGRQVSAELLKSSRAAAEQSGALFVDMAAASAGHDACSASPWVNGAKPASGAPFHPSAAGAEGTAQAIFKAISSKTP